MEKSVQELPVVQVHVGLGLELLQGNAVATHLNVVLHHSLKVCNKLVNKSIKQNK